MAQYLIWFNAKQKIVKVSIVGFTHYKVGDFNSYGHELIYKERLKVEYANRGQKKKKSLRRLIFGRFIEKRKRRKELEYCGLLYEQEFMRDGRSNHFRHF